jgi:hypothetical protein
MTDKNIQFSQGQVDFGNGFIVNKSLTFNEFMSAFKNHDYIDHGGQSDQHAVSLKKVKFLGLNVAVTFNFSKEKIDYLGIAWLDGAVYRNGSGYDVDIDELPKEKNRLSKKCARALDQQPNEKSEWSDRFDLQWGKVWISAEPISLTCGITIKFS